MEYRVLDEAAQRAIKAEVTAGHAKHLLELEAGHYRDVVRQAVAQAVADGAAPGSEEQQRAATEAQSWIAEQASFEVEHAALLGVMDTAVAALDAVAVVELADQAPADVPPPEIPVP